MNEDDKEVYFQEVDDGLDWSKAQHETLPDGSQQTVVPLREPLIVLSVPYYTARITGVE